MSLPGRPQEQLRVTTALLPDEATSLVQDIAILCHGLGDHKNGFVLPQLAEALAKAGMSSLRFDFPGNGESDGTFRYANMMDEVCEFSFLFVTVRVSPDILLQ